MTIGTRALSTRRYRPQQVSRRTARVIAIAVLLVWSLFPIYTMLKISLSPFTEMFDDSLWPKHLSIDAFTTALTQDAYGVKNFWQEMGNSAIVSALTAIVVLAIASTSCFAIDRLQAKWGKHLSTMALATYAIPLSFLAIPMFKVMATYGLLDSLWSLTLAEIAWCTPYGIWIFTQYSAQSIPRELDESARVDGASSWRIYWSLFLPLMKPISVTIGAYAFVHAWNEYLLAFILLNSSENFTVPIGLANFMNTDQPAVNVLMSAAIIYSVPPLLIYLFFQRDVSSGLGMGAVKG